MTNKPNIYTDAPAPKRQLQITDRVMIYHKPATFERPEGVGELQRKLRSRKPGLELWSVKIGKEQVDRYISIDTEVNIF